MKEAIIQYEDTPSGGHLAISWKPLVRCKDCKHYHNGFNCDLLQKPIMTGDDYYCADGERRTE